LSGAGHCELDQQCLQIHAARRTSRFTGTCLARVKARIIEQPFLPDDELFQVVEKARDLTFKFHELAGDGLPSSEG